MAKAKMIKEEKILTPAEELEILKKDFVTYQIDKTLKITALREILQSFTGVDTLVKNAARQAYNSIVVFEMAAQRKAELEEKLKEGEN